MKRVGILAREEILNNKKILYIPKNIYLNLYKKASIIIIPYHKNMPYSLVSTLVNSLDGIVIPGGDNEYSLEISLIKDLYNENMPVLGICLGMQEMALAFKGKLGHLQGNFHKTDKIDAHKVKVQQGSLFYNIINQKEIMVNSRHKDYVQKTNLFISGVSEDGIIEVIEDKQKKFFLGVQFHPEDMPKKMAQKIFNAFLDSL